MLKGKGFSIVGLMLGIIVIGVGCIVVLPYVINPERDRIAKAQEQILEIDDALEAYKADNGRYPTEEQGLDALMREPHIAPIARNWRSGGYVQLTSDPWGHAYVYENNSGQPSVYSLGPSGKGGDDIVRAP